MYFPPWLNQPLRRHGATKLSPSETQQPCGFRHCLYLFTGVRPPLRLYEGRESGVLYINNTSNPHGCWVSGGDRPVSLNAMNGKKGWRGWCKKSMSRAIESSCHNRPALFTGGAA